VIVYSLRCRTGHEFEGWFASAAAFDQQAAGGKLVCPVCDTHRIEKAPMAPALSGTKKTAPAAEEMKKMRRFMTGMRKYIQDHADYVGKTFPEEARRIHYGESEERHIYGEATLQEAKELIEEGVDVAPLPPDLDEEAN